MKYFLPISLLIACTYEKPSLTDTGMDTGSTVEEAVTGQVSGEIDCTGWYTDVWSVELATGQVAIATVDTVADETAFDPALLMGTLTDAVDGVVAVSVIADDEVVCSFAPPQDGAACPQGTLTAEEDMTVGLVVDVAQDPCAGDDSKAGYVMNLTVDGEPVTPTLVKANRLVDL